MLDVAEAVLVDSSVFGNGELGDTIDRLAGALDEVIPDRATWGTLPHQREAAQAAEDLFRASRPR